MKTINGFSYDYSGVKPLHIFTKDERSITVYREQYGYVLLQKDKKNQQRLKVNEVELNSFIINLVNGGWDEMHA